MPPVPILQPAPASRHFSNKASTTDAHHYHPPETVSTAANLKLRDPDHNLAGESAGGYHDMLLISGADLKPGDVIEKDGHTLVMRVSEGGTLCATDISDGKYYGVPGMAHYKALVINGSTYILVSNEHL